MTKKTIPELDDGTLISGLETLTHVSIDGISKRLPMSPKPTFLIPARNQADLEASILGTNITVPDNSAITIAIIDNFPLSKPIIVGENSFLEILGTTIGLNIDYTGTGAMFQVTNPAIPPISIHLHNFTVITSLSNKIVFDIKTSETVILERFGIRGFDEMGIIETFGLEIKTVFLLDPVVGFVFKNIQLGDITPISINHTTPPANDVVSMTFISSVISKIKIDNASNFNAGVKSSLLFIDDNLPTGSSFTIENSSIDAGDFFKTGAGNTVVTAIIDNGSGKIRCGATSHGLVDGEFAILSGFAAQTTYNGAFKITLVDANLFDVEEVDFIATDNGTVSGTSLDHTDIRVTANDNPNQSDSMFTGNAGLELFGSEISSSSLAQDAFEVITSASWVIDNLERFSIGVNNEGQLIASDPAARRYKIDYSATLEKAGGGGLDIGIVILKNGSIISFNAPHTVNTGLVQISGSDIIELIATDTVQIAVINYDGSAAVIETSQVNMVINKA